MTATGTVKATRAGGPRRRLESCARPDGGGAAITRSVRRGVPWRGARQGRCGGTRRAAPSRDPAWDLRFSRSWWIEIEESRLGRVIWAMSCVFER